VGHIEEPLEDVAVLALEYENGAFGTLHAGYLLPRQLPAENYLVYRGLEGWADWNPWGGAKLEMASTSPEWSDDPHRTTNYTFEDYSGYGRGRFVLEWIQGFIDDIRAGRESSMTAEDALHILQSIEAAYESARTGRRVEVSYDL
jgi:predicted dehydrogenase